jgi:hypothetical protein
MTTDFNQVGASSGAAQLGSIAGAGIGLLAGPVGSGAGAAAGEALGKLLEELLGGQSDRPDLGETLSSAYEAATEEDGISPNESKAIAATAEALGSAEGSSLSSEDVTDMLNEFIGKAQEDGNFGQADLDAYKSLLSLVSGGGDGAQAGPASGGWLNTAGSGSGEGNAGIPGGPERSGGMATYLFDLYSAQFAGGQQQMAEDEEGVSGGSA